MIVYSGDITKYLYFIAFDAIDLITRETGLTGFAVNRSRNGAAEVAMTTPTVIEIGNGKYALLMDEDMVIGIGNDAEEMVFDISVAGMVDVTVSITLESAKVKVTDIVTGVWSDKLTTYVDGEAGKRLKGITAVPTLEGTVDDVAATSESFVSTLIGYGDTFFNDALLLVEFAPDEWQGRAVTTYTSATGVFTVDEPFISPPPNTSPVVIQITHIHPVVEIQAGLAIRSAQITTQDILDSGDIDGSSIEENARLCAAALYGKSSGAGSGTITYTGVNDLINTDRIIATNDGIGNRTLITLNKGV